MSIAVVGLGDHPLNDRALAALASASLVAGGRRQLDAVAHLVRPNARQVELAGDLGRALDTVTGATEPVAVLASGDPGFFGIVRTLAERAGPDALDVVPAVSSVASAFARAGLSWDDALVVSAHGRQAHPAVNACRRHPKVAVLTSPTFGPAALARALEGLGRTFVVVEAAGTAGERVTRGDATAVMAGEFADPNVVLCLDPRRGAGTKGRRWPPRTTPDRWALPEEAFEHRDGMVTKAEARAVALAWLGPGVGDLVWDVGAGSGAVGIEAAILGAAVIAVESDARQRRRIRANADRHGVPVDVVGGAAPRALAGLPDPDAVFVGGGGAALTEIVRTAADRARRAVVVALATVERVGAARRALDDAGLAVDGTVVQAARLLPLGGGTRLAATNPVFLLGGRR